MEQAYREDCLLPLSHIIKEHFILFVHWWISWAILLSPQKIRKDPGATRLPCRRSMASTLLFLLMRTTAPTLFIIVSPRIIFQCIMVTGPFASILSMQKI